MLLNDKEKRQLKIQYLIKLLVILVAFVLIIMGATQDKTALLIAGWAVLLLAIFVPARKPRSPRAEALLNWSSIRQEILANGTASKATLTSVERSGFVNHKPFVHIQYLHNAENGQAYSIEEWIALPDYILPQLRPQLEVPVICSKDDPAKVTLDIERFLQT